MTEKHQPIKVIALTLIILSALPLACRADEDNVEILGWVENVRLIDPDIELKAKLDSGAETTSLDARIIKKFRQNGRRWVRFSVRDRVTEKSFVIVRERVRTIGVVQHDGSRQTRPVVEMKICLAGRLMKTEVSLVDRSEFNYPVLLGRNSLAGIALIDSGDTFLSSPECDKDPGGSAQ
jgi:hypothetical protein